MGIIAREEISRQAAIFKGSSKCIAWFNYIDDWQEDNHILNWLAIRYLYLTTGQHHYKIPEDKYRKLWDHCNNASSKLGRHPSHDKYFRSSNADKNNLQDKDVRSPWLSSLWTLQEISLCPHMIPMSRNWEPLQAAAGRPITMSELVNLASDLDFYQHNPQGQKAEGVQETAASLPKSKRNPPNGEIKLSYLFEESQIPFSSSRTSILIQGNLRNCRGRRAEAIMSAVNVVEWFNPKTDQEENLVLGIYPLSFVKEAARKFGPEFAMARKPIGSPDSSSGSKFFRQLQRGSLLPFEKLGAPVPTTVWPIQVLEDRWGPVFDSWEFLPSGSVRMRKAAILGQKCSNSKEPIAKITVNVYWGEEIAQPKRLTVALEDWLSKLPPKYCTYVMKISEAEGLILQGFSKDLSSSHKEPLRLIKVGCVDLCAEKNLSLIENLERWDVPVKEVDWIVL